MVHWVDRGLSGVKEIKAIGEEEFFIYNFDWHCEGYALATRVATTLEVLPRLMLETVAVFAIMSAIAIGFAQGKTSVEVLNSISLFAIASFRLLPAVNRAIGSLTSMRYHASCLEVIYQDYRSLKILPEYSDPDRRHYPTETTALDLTEALEFKHITYTYPDSDRPAIDDLSLVIPQGKRVGLVGASGAGKTTLVDLLLGLLVPDKGQILADGIDIDRSPHQWQELVGYIPQHIYLCDDTIAANIAFGYCSEDINLPRLWNVLRAVKMYDFVSNLPDGSNTMVGESGVRLSGGQRQRIGIARAMYRNPQLLVMDEATSALDNQTERDVSEAIERLSRNKTVITIAHRLTTVKNCDIIYVMEGGQIVDRGTYAELLAHSPKFQQLALVGIDND
jgi:ATP-binding cassette, subfamily B, bacterial PglK